MARGKPGTQKNSEGWKILRELTKDELKRFMDKVDIQDGDDGCWLWTASTNRTGYGEFFLKDLGKVTAHRQSYRHYIGPIPDGKMLDHLCRTRNCVNPRHLEPVSGHENTIRGEGPTADAAAKTECVNGHPLIEENVMWIKGVRHCKKCNAERTRKWAKRKKDKEFFSQEGKGMIDGRPI